MHSFALLPDDLPSLRCAPCLFSSRQNKSHRQTRDRPEVPRAKIKSGSRSAFLFPLTVTVRLAHHNVCPALLRLILILLTFFEHENTQKTLLTLQPTSEDHLLWLIDFCFPSSLTALALFTNHHFSTDFDSKASQSICSLPIGCNQLEGEERQRRRTEGAAGIA
jgi:hypothetical protein